MLAQTKDRTPGCSLLGSYLDDLRTTLFRQTLFAEFELRVPRAGGKGGAAGRRKAHRDLSESLLKEYYGDAAGVCKVDDLYGIEWAYIPHFYYDFYVYQYATSITASAQIAAEHPRGQDFQEPRRLPQDALLGLVQVSHRPAEGRRRGHDHLGPFNAAIKEMNDTMDEMEKLLAGK